MLDLEDLQAEEKSKLTSLTREYESLLAEVTRTQEAAEQAEQQVVSMEEKRQGTLKALDDLKVNLCEVCAPTLLGILLYGILCHCTWGLCSNTFTAAKCHYMCLNMLRLQHESVGHNCEREWPISSLLLWERLVKRDLPITQAHFCIGIANGQHLALHMYLCSKVAGRIDTFANCQWLLTLVAQFL